MSYRFHVLLAAAIGATFWSPSAQAQTNPERPTPAVPQEGLATPQWKAFRIRNVRASLMASWLTPPPKMAPRPAFMPPIVAPLSYKIPPTWAAGRSVSEVAEFLMLPGGVQTVAAVDSQNVLWSLGTPTGLQQMAEKIALLDKPLRQVEVGARYIAISDADVQTLGIDFARGEGKIEVGMAGANIEDQILALIAQKRARILTEPRILAASGESVSLTSLTTSPVIVSLDYKDDQVQIRDLRAGDTPEDYHVIGVSTTIGLSATPTLQPDGTISISLGPLRTLGLSGSQKDVLAKSNVLSSSMDIFLKDLDGIPTRPLILKDRQTAALRGFTWPVGVSGFRDDLKAPAMNVLVLLQPRVLRRAGDEVIAALPR